MLITRLHKFLTAPTAKIFSPAGIFWFSLSLTFAAIYSLMALQQGFSAEYVVQDDARQHVFWMQRFLDPQLFPQDLIADYFQSVAPAGYTFFYKIPAVFGVDPLLLSKLLPPILGLVTTAYTFAVSLQLLPVPFAGFLSTLLLNQYLWMRDDLVSATAVAFVYPFFAAFLYYLLRGSFWGVCSAIAFLGLFYPQCVFIAGGILILQLLQWRENKLQWVRDRQKYWVSATGLAVTIFVLSLYALKSSGEYGPVVTAAEAKMMPEFLPGGISKFFSNDPGDFWFTGQRSGMMPRFGTVLPLVATALFPILLLFRSRLELLKQIQPTIRILLDTTVASLTMFVAAHVLLFRLHLPSRYTEHTLRIVTALLAGMALTILFDAIFRAIETPKKNHHFSPIKKAFLWLSAVGIFTFLLAQPSLLKRFPRTDYIVGQSPRLYQFFAQQPKDILVASVAEEVNNIPTFSHRSILVGGEGYPVPYHQGYYQKIRDRTLDLITAQYSPDAETLKQFIVKYGIDFWLVEAGDFTSEYITRDRWMMQYPTVTNQAIAQLQQGQIPALAKMRDRCQVFQVDQFQVLQADCLIQ